MARVPFVTRKVVIAAVVAVGLVFFAAWTAATLATARGSPFGAFPSTTIRIVSGRAITIACALAVRSVLILFEMSFIVWGKYNEKNSKSQQSWVHDHCVSAPGNSTVFFLT